LEEEENYNSVRKLISLYSGWVENYPFNFEEDSERKKIEFDEENIVDLIKVMDVVKNQFKDDAKKYEFIRSKVKQFILTLISPPKPFDTPTINLLQVSKLIIANRL